MHTAAIDVELTHAVRLHRRSSDHRRGQQGGSTCYFRDPDAIVLEILQPPPHRFETHLRAQHA